ncbi:MAG: glycogen/starch synthase [Desulfobacterales bacterium]|uniref:starch synthase n=1 Tax=Candidatus Desulfatibia profunda TaxID=2841695 RepID=A0A8J6THJ5_9BACT|nr:glycogen/starch synthase [Candidatus Desulfatibia profunda]MBL7180396.1 glycogen/starch synthase [Desulfobacterales bacterium]
MSSQSTNPRVLIVTPEVTYLPDGMGDISNGLNAKAGGLADVSAALISSLYHLGADVHVALPDYRSIFTGHLPPLIRRERYTIRKNVPHERMHLAQDRAFFYLDRIYSGYAFENIKISLAFQREVINNIVPKVRPDLIHCNDWMTGLIPAMARQLGIPCLFTVHNIHTIKSTLAEIEDRGIDAAWFWQNLFYEQFPSTYENIRNAVPVDLLASGIFAAHFVNTVSPTFLAEMVEGRHNFVKSSLRQELAHKKNAGCAVGILNAPDPSYDPSTDEALSCKYSATNHVFGKKANKQTLQKTLGLIQNAQAPIFFWPSRLDPVQKGCQLLAEILYSVVSRYWDRNLQIVFVADGEFQRHFNDIVGFHNLSERVAVRGFNERLARLAYGAADFVLMPSSFEPCGLPQMIGAIYGALPVAHDTGGIHDTITHLDVAKDTGNGFLFKTFDAGGLSWAMDQAMRFYQMPLNKRQRQINRIMLQSAAMFNHQVTAQRYIDLYEKMLLRPLINPMNLAGQVIPIHRDKEALYSQTNREEYDENGSLETVWRNQQTSQREG